jgi:hypothetical protein
MHDSTGRIAASVLPPGRRREDQAMLAFEDRRYRLGLRRAQAGPAQRVDDVVLQRPVQTLKGFHAH